MASSGSIAAVAPAASVDAAGTGQPTTGTIEATSTAPTTSASGSGAPVTGTIGGSAPRSRTAGVAASATEPETGWQIRAVTDTGTLVNLIGGVNVDRVHRGINGDEYAELSIPTSHPDADLFDLFAWEIQIWLDGELYLWGRPARLDASREGSSDSIAVRVDGLFSYFHDVYVGDIRPNHIIPPHEDPNPTGGVPAAWTAAADVDEYGLVPNAWVFWQSPKGLQVNEFTTEEEFGYVYQRFTVPAELDRVPFAASAWMNVSDDLNSPEYGGPPFENRGLVIMRLDSGTLAQIGEIQNAEITDDTPRNKVIRLQTGELVPDAGDIIEVRLYTPDAWVAWRFVGLYDGRGPSVYHKDKTAAFKTLVEHGQDTSIGKQDRRMSVSVTPIDERVTKTWPWWRRDNIGEQLEGLADTFEFEVQTTTTTRALVAKHRVGVTLPDVLTKEDFVAWGLGMDVSNAASRVFRQGEGSGVARDEWVATDTSALRGNVREALVFAPVDEQLSGLRDGAEQQLARMRNVARLPRARITGELAKTIRAGDTVTVNLDHGWAQYSGAARALAVDFDGRARTAELHLEPELSE